MKTIVLSSILLLINISLHAQEKPAKWQGGFYVDVAKKEFRNGDQRGALEGFQAGLEAGYRVAEHFSLTGGVEFWGPDDRFGVVTGFRYYPNRNFFFRARTLFRTSVGAGWTKALGKSLNIEVMGDYYIQESIAARVGLSYTW